MAHIEKTKDHGNDPISCGDLTLYTSYFTYKEKRFELSDVEHIQQFEFGVGVRYHSNSTTTGKDQSAGIVMSTGKTIPIRAKSGMFSGEQKSWAFSRILKSISVITYKQRHGDYVAYFNENGYLLYDKTKFFPRGKIITRKGNELSLDDYCFRSEPSCIRLEKKAPSKSSFLGRKLLSRFPNAKIYGFILHGELMIRTTVDADVFIDLINELYS